MTPAEFWLFMTPKFLMTLEPDANVVVPPNSQSAPRLLLIVALVKFRLPMIWLLLLIVMLLPVSRMARPAEEV